MDHKPDEPIMKRITFVPDWRDSWRWFSMQAQALATGLLAGWSMLPPEWQQLVPRWMIFNMVYAVLVLGMIGRVVQQPIKAEPAAEDPAPPGGQP